MSATTFSIALEALAGLVGARRPQFAIGICRLEGRDAEVAEVSSGFHALCPSHRLADAAAVFGEGREMAVFDPAHFDLIASFGAASPIPGPPDAPVRYLVALGARPCRLTPGLRAALEDAAAIVAGLLDPQAPAGAGEGPAPAAQPQPQEAGVTLPRLGAYRMIEAAQAGRTPSAAFALLLIDVDRFRTLNETLGSSAGDLVLELMRGRLNAALLPQDELARLEGDRFLVLAARPAVELQPFARSLLDLIGQPIRLGPQVVTVQASIGIVASPAMDLPTHTLLMQADGALRRAKAEGRNRYALHEAHHVAAMLERSQIELDLAQATGSGQMHLVFQPIVDLETGRIDGVEALMRWIHPTRGEIKPASFIPVAEATGMILPLGSWALKTACREARRLPPGLKLAVNISPLQFHQPDFTAQIDAVLAETGFPPERLELEITETVLMRDNPETIAQIETLISRGIRIALDDFGTGYSALAYLGRLPHQRIKLDHSFVQDLSNPATAELIRAIIALARAQGVAITAEGVEVPEQLAVVTAMGFTHAQGFVTGAPVRDPADLAELHTALAAR